MNQPLAIVGASARAAAASAVRAGFQPLAADLFADADLRRIATATRISPYPEGFIDWMRTIEPPVWMYTGALENHPDLVDQLGWIAPLWGNSGDVLARVRSPWELAEILSTAGLLFPEVRESAEALPRDGSWLMKTYAGASGSGVRAWTDEQEANNNEIAACFQKRIEGVPCAAVFVASGDRAKLLGVTRQLIGETWLGGQGFQYCGSIGPWPISERTRATIERLGGILVKHFELIGLFGVDFILNGDNVWTLEVNPRYTASVEIVERFTGASAIREHAIACGATLAEKTSPITEQIQPASGKAIVFARRDLTISALFAEQALEQAFESPWPSLADISTAGTQVEAGRPVLTIFGNGDSVDQVERDLHQRVAELEKKIYSST
ncbi:MAG TPA: ATP-grasp domain-containing protein [Lacipirellulaceae bacterium]|nr:ATP-grasp domain-containing protein [Lacipirellulaceae bacterium]